MPEPKSEDKRQNFRHKTLTFRGSSLALVRRTLKMLEAGYYPARIAQILGKARQHVDYYVKRLEKAGYIERAESLQRLKHGLYVKKSRGVITLYHVTQAGKNFLAGIDSRALGRVVRLHNCYFKYPIVRQPGKRIDWRRVELNNWTQLIGLEMGLTVRKNPESVEVIARVVDGKDPFKLLLRARAESDHLAGYLERKFDMVLGRAVLSRKPHFGVYDPVAGKSSRFYELSDDVAKIDESEGYGEIDWYDPQTAKDYLLMPGKIRKLEEDISDIKEGQRLFSEGMLQHMAMIQEIRVLVEALRKTAETMEKGRS